MAKSMGIGEIGMPTISFVRQFRFTLKGKYLDEWFIKSANYSLHSKTMTVSILEVFGNDERNVIEAQRWAEGIENGNYEDEELTLTTYDACGEEIYAIKFKGLEIKDRCSYFDYEKNDVSIQEVHLTFKSYAKAKITEKIHPTTNREVEINHLNAKTWIESTPKNKGDK